MNEVEAAFKNFCQHLGEQENIPQIVQEFKKLLRQQRDSVLRNTITELFYTRDIRLGPGRRQVFLSLFKALHEEMPDLAERLLAFIPSYGSWRDVFQLAEQCPALRKVALEFAATNFRADEEEWARSQNRRRLSLVGKWAPREGKAQHDLAVAFAKVLVGEGVGYRNRMAIYRKRLGAMNRHLETVEVLECAGRWDEIRPEAVPERARNIKRSAYLNERVDSDEIVQRRSDDVKRIQCRWNFQDAKERLETKAIWSMTTRHDAWMAACKPKNRYKGLEYTVDQWLNGGWRGVL